MSITAVRARHEEERTLAWSSITSTYAGVGTELAHPARCIYILNNTDRALTFSIGGSLAWITLPASGYIFWDVASNQSLNRGWYIAEGERLYAKTPTTNPTQGTVYFSVMYGQEH
jgi:hypothetical protein